ncbi:MAG: hypothetical protein ISS47_06830, partial [Candidatus Omnitrophica bacterium]|nr:hypothetical protein [Candidatus Omnitrophota bacterium]
MNSDKKFYILYSFIILGVLFGIFYPRLSSPPISDYWEMFYSFHHLEEFPGSFKCLNILNFDAVEQVGYRPLAHLFYYILHLVFGSNFVFFNIVNFLLYFLSVIIFYRFALYFVKNRVLAGVFIGLFAFLFSHFDILLWSCHLYIIVGFSMFLLGFMAYMRFLKTNKLSLLFSVILCFLIGLWCYEAFFLWPLAIIILSRINGIRTKTSPDIKKIVKAVWLILGAVYLLDFLFYLFVKSVGTYENHLDTILDFLKLRVFVSSGFLAFFNVLYNNIAVNIYPLLPFPLKVTENIYMAGPVINYIKTNPKIVFIEGALVGITFFWFFFTLYRKKYFEEIKIIGLFLFLMLSELYIVFFGKLSVSHSFAYCLTEFRYQYIPNAFLILIVLYVIYRFFKPSKIKQRIVCLALIPFFVLNIYCSQRVIGIYNSHLVNLKKMISSIRSGINKEYINENDKIYIDEDIPDYLPSLCWN